MIEEWREHPQHKGYMVSTLGRIIGRRGHLLKPGTNHRSGYRYVGIARADGTGKCDSHHVHKLVLETFVGYRPEGLEASHLDGNKENNALSNLRWETRLQNMHRQNDHGTRAVNRGLAKLDEEQIKAIRIRLEAGERGCNIAHEFGVSISTISRIKLRRTYNYASTSR